MSYKWDKFNIKTFDAETIVYCDGFFMPELSTLEQTEIISKKYDKPIHIIYVGKINKENTLKLNLNTDSQPAFLTINIENDFPAFLNIFIKNAGKNSEIRGHILLKNKSDLSVKIIAEHTAPNTGILLQTKIIGFKNSYSRISGTAIINKGCENTVSDIKFSGHTIDKSAKIRFIPAQKIQSVPKIAEHSAYMFDINKEQENYLRSTGLSGTEVKNIAQEAFMNDFNLF
jgi:hypothetical protein